LKLLVTGAAGFIGMHASKRLLERGHDVFGVDNLNPYYDPALKRARLDELRPFPGFSFEQLDVADERAMATVFESKRFDTVLHLAAQAGVRYSLQNPMAYIASNVAGFLNILEGCRKAKIAHLCYASSSSVYGANTEMPFREEDRVDRPVSLYAATKRANELMAESYSASFGIPCTGLRFFTVYGPWGRPDMALFIFTRAILEGKPIRVFNGGDMLRDFTYIDDIVEVVTAVVERPHPGAKGGPQSPSLPLSRLFNIGHGSPVKLMDFVHAVEHALGKKAQIELAPMQVGDVQATYASTEKLRAEIGYAPPTPIEVGVGRFVAWYQARYVGSGAGGQAA
jgi:UDP-glucuronate 4-epimerase